MNGPRHVFYPIVDLDADDIGEYEGTKMQEVFQNPIWEATTNSITMLIFGILMTTVVTLCKRFGILQKKIFNLEPLMNDFLKQKN